MLVLNVIPKHVENIKNIFIYRANNISSIKIARQQFIKQYVLNGKMSNNLYIAVNGINLS